MSARRIARSSDPRSGEDQINALSPRGPGLTPTAPLGANQTPDPLSSVEDSERLLEDLLRRFGTPLPGPWRHGGLNE
jgi:hypothetical protein